MKSSKITLMIGTWVMILVLIGASAVSANINNPDFYYYNGQQYMFATNDTTVSVTFIAGLKSPMNIDHPAIDTIPLGPGDAPDCYVYQLRDTWTYGVDSAVVSLNEDALDFNILVTNPVLHYETSDEAVDVYPSSEIGVKLIDGVSIDQVTGSFPVEVAIEKDTTWESLNMYATMNYGVPYNPYVFYGTNEFTLRITPGTGETVIAVANALYEDGTLVEFASPNLGGNNRPEVVESTSAKDGSTWGEAPDDPIGSDENRKGDPNDELYSWQWNLHGTYGIDYPQSLDILPQDEDITIAIISAGYHSSHVNPDVDPAIFLDYDAAGDDITLPDNIPDGDVTIPDNYINRYLMSSKTVSFWLQGDWAAVAIAAKTNNVEGIAGIASDNIRILRIKAVDNNGLTRDSDLARASDLPSLLAAFGVVSASYWTFNLYFPSDMIEAAIDRAYKYHQVIVCPAGEVNGELAFPANLPKTISVAGINEGGVEMGWNGPGADFAAPGMKIYTGDPPDSLGFSPYWDLCASNPDYTCVYTGTGAAGTMFTGVVARIFQQVPQATKMWHDQTSRLGIADYHPMDYIYGVCAANAEDKGKSVNVINGRINIYKSLEYVWRGDVDMSSSVDIDDVVYLINYIFGGGPAPEPVSYSTGDANCSGDVDIDDVVYLINYIFGNGPSPFGGCYQQT
jgi:hypothetical protein